MAYPKIPTSSTDTEHFVDIQTTTRLRRLESLFNRPDLTSVQRKYMKKYHKHLVEKGLRLESQRAYIQNLYLLIKRTKKLPSKLTKKDLENYLGYLEKEFKDKTITERRLFLIYHMEWLHGKPRAEIPLIKNIKIKKIKGMALPEEILSPDEIKKMTQVAFNLRDKALVMLLYETGTRKGEFLQLKIKHIQLVNEKGRKYGFATVPMGKTSSRKLPLIYSLPHVTAWLNSHPNRDDPEQPLFINQGAWLNRALGEDGLKRLLKILAERSGVKKKVYPHLFRHSRMTELAKELTEQELKKFAGWTPTSNMAAVYVHLSGEDVSNKLLSNAGLIDHKKGNKERASLMAIECPDCNKVHGSYVKYCLCERILDPNKAVKQINEHKDHKSEMELMKQTLLGIQKQLKIEAVSEVKSLKKKN